jgi:hypothetical protein
MTNKTKLIDNDGFQTYVEVVNCTKPENYKTIRFTTVFSRSRHPQGEREAYQITLAPDDYNKLINILSKDDTPETMAEIFSRIP